MEDPLPENIQGSKQVKYTHQMNHHIQWGYVALGVAVIVLALSFGPPLLGDSEGDRADADGEDGGGLGQ